MLIKKNNLPPQPELDIPALERSLELSSLTNSYKLYWFAAILEEINACSAEISFRRMIILMLVKCWYTVLKFRLSLGIQDTLYRLVHYLHDKYEIPAEINETDLKDLLFKLEDMELEKGLKEFTRYVPYRFLSTFYESELRAKTDYLKNGIIETLSCRDDRAIYRVRTSEAKIEINYNWFEYLYCNMAIVTGWHRYRLVEYLQRRNPNIPSVIDKIELPAERNLTDAKKYWKGVMDIIEINDIYTGIPVTRADLSLDHFIPWSFVMHDKLWNLSPVAKKTNSSKSDLLPSVSKYMDNFIDLQYRALTIALDHGVSKRLLEDYLMLGNGIELIRSINEIKFKETLRNTILPLHRIALNQGFGLWE